MAERTQIVMEGVSLVWMESPLCCRGRDTPLAAVCPHERGVCADNESLAGVQLQTFTAFIPHVHYTHSLSQTHTHWHVHTIIYTQSVINLFTSCRARHCLCVLSVDERVTSI